MNNELEELILKLQEEYDYLKGELEKCAKEWDFEGAEAFRKPTIYTRWQLQILQGLMNSNSQKIVAVKAKIRKIKNFEKLDQPEFTANYLKRKLAEYQEEIKLLEQYPIPDQVDNDELIGAIIKLMNGEISSFELNFDRKRINLIVQQNSDTLDLMVKCQDRSKTVEYFIGQHGISELKKIGFSEIEELLILKIGNHKESEIQIYLQVIARIVFEALRIPGNETATLKINGSI